MGPDFCETDNNEKVNYSGKIDALVFEGGEMPDSYSWPEELILKVRLETARDQVNMLLNTGEIQSVTLITDYEELMNFAKNHPEHKKRLFLIDTKSKNISESKNISKSKNKVTDTAMPDTAPMSGADMDIDSRKSGFDMSQGPESFHFGKTLKEIINKRELHKVLICGGGSTPLLSKEEISHVCRRLLQAGNRGSGWEDSLLYSNNPQSGDIVAFTPAFAINDMTLPESDNALVMGLRYEVGLNFELIPFSVGILFDIDTPTELFFLLEHPRTSKKTKKILDCLSPGEKKMINEGMDRFLKVKDVFSGYYEDVILAGRVSGSIITHINENIKVRLRVFSEERGMKAMGRIESREVKSLLGYFIEDMGIDRFFGYLETLGRGCVIDSRVIFHHFGAGDKTSDRFYSDLFMPGEIENSFIKEFTQRAKDARIPVIMGGHSLVSGGLYELVEQIKM